MAVYRGPYVSLDLTKEGVWLDMERDDLGNTRYWMTIEGEEIELTERQHQVLIEQRAEARKNAMQEAEERIIKLLEGYSDGELLVIPTGEISALIKGEQK